MKFHKLICFVLIMLTVVLNTETINAKLKALWQMDHKTKANIIVNHSGVESGVISGDPELVEGKYGKAYKFDGVDDYITMPDGPEY